MKSVFIYWIITALFIGLILFNATFLDFGNLLENESFIALISILATLCALALLWLLFFAQKFNQNKT